MSTAKELIGVLFDLWKTDPDDPKDTDTIRKLIDKANEINDTLDNDIERDHSVLPNNEIVKYAMKLSRK